MNEFDDMGKFETGILGSIIVWILWIPLISLIMVLNSLSELIEYENKAWYALRQGALFCILIIIILSYIDFTGVHQKLKCIIIYSSGKCSKASPDLDILCIRQYLCSM